MQIYENIMKQKTISYISELLNERGYRVFSNDKLNYNLNIVAIRNGREITNRFSDNLYVFWRYKGEWTLLHFPITTKPGESYFNNKYIKKLGGVAQLKEGRYKYHLGKHKGLYDALIPLTPSVIERLDINKKVVGTFTGYFGINIHRASELGNSKKVNLWSAGCQVIPTGYNLFMEVIKKSFDNFPHVTYTLIEL